MTVELIAHTLVGRRVPTLALRGTDQSLHVLADEPGVTVVYAYPRTSPPDAPPIEGWDQIPGARGCTPQSCGYRDHYSDLLAAGATRVFGLSTQSTVYQAEVVERLGLPFALLSDENLEFTRALELETFEAAGMTLLKRITLIIRDGCIEHVFYPVNDPPRNANEVIAHLRAKST